MKNIKISLTAFALVALSLSLVLSGCNNDDDDDTTKVFGTITFDNAATWATWADSGEVQVTIFPEFTLDPLGGWGPVPDNFFGPNVPGGTFAVGAPYNAQNPVILEYVPAKNQYTYEIEVEPGRYSALAVGFRHDFVNDPTLKSATLGVHWDNPTQVSHGIVIRINAGGNIIPVYNYPAPVTFEVKDGEQKEINFKADFDFVKSWYR